MVGFIVTEGFVVTGAGFCVDEGTAFGVGRVSTGWGGKYSKVVFFGVGGGGGDFVVRGCVGGDFVVVTTGRGVGGITFGRISTDFGGKYSKVVFA